MPAVWPWSGRKRRRTYPSTGTPVPVHIAIASPDFLAADSVGLESMGLPPHAVGYLQYVAQLGTDQFDLARIDVRGERPESVRRVFRVHDSVQQHLDRLLEIRRPASPTFMPGCGAQAALLAWAGRSGRPAQPGNQPALR